MSVQIEANVQCAYEIGKTTQRKSEEEATSSAKAARQGPFGEFCDQDFEEEIEGPMDNLEQPSTSHEEAGEERSGSEDPKPTKPKKPAKHDAASLKLKLVKAKAKLAWQDHLSSSVRVAQLMGTAPRMVDREVAGGGPARFKVHPSHVTMAIRSIVHCKACGYWASKKSQKLQEPCPRKPPHSDGAHKLKRMLKGLHPDAKVRAWPDGHDARVPSQPIAIDWS